MKFAVGAWVAVIGYALVYTGASYFTGNPVSLGSALGIGSAIAPSGADTAAVPGDPGLIAGIAGTAVKQTSANTTRGTQLI